jgi:hypothetical protein
MRRALVLAVLLPASTGTAGPCIERPLGAFSTQVSSGGTALTARVLLRDGREFVAGGTAYGGGPSPDASLAGKPIAAMPTPRAQAIATELADGRVLITGGSRRATGSDETVAHAQIYDRKTGAWTEAAPMMTGRVGHTATLMADGRVLVVGGQVEGQYTRTAEIFDPVKGVWSRASTAPTERKAHAAVGLPDGKVLVVGGYGPDSDGLKSAELYDPACDAWTSAGSANQRYSAPALAVLGDGRILALTSLGNLAVVEAGKELRSSAVGDIYDPAKRTWQAISPVKDVGDAGQTRLEVRGKTVVRCAEVMVASSSRRPLECHTYDVVADRWRKK